MLTDTLTKLGQPVTTCITPPRPPGLPPNLPWNPPPSCTTTTPTVTEVKAFAWNLDNRLKQVAMPSGAIHSYEYDANGLRTQKNENGIETRFVLDGPSVTEEVGIDGATTVSYVTNPHVIDEILSFERQSATYYPLIDALGSVYAIADSSGNVTRNYSYDVFGERSSSASSPTAVNLSFGYTGREHDAAGLRHHRDRYYDPNTGRYLQPEPLAQDARYVARTAALAHSLPAYAYATSNPIAITDSNGNEPNHCPSKQAPIRDPRLDTICPGYDLLYGCVQSDWNSLPKSEQCKQCKDRAAALKGPAPVCGRMLDSACDTYFCELLTVCR